MEMHLIEVDDKVFKYLQKNAGPLVDTPNSVLTKLLFKGINYKGLIDTYFETLKQLPVDYLLVQHY